MNTIRSTHTEPSDLPADGSPSPADLPLHLIDDTLSLYHPEYRSIVSARFAARTLDCEIRIPPYPYTRESVFSYLTGPTAVLLVAQMGYLAIRAAIADSATVRDILSDSGFIAARDRGQIVFSQLHMNFSRQISSDTTALGSLSFGKPHHLKNWLTARMAVSIGSDAFTCSGIVAIPTP